MSFVNTYVAKKFEILTKKLCEPLCVSISDEQSILVKTVYRNYHVSINHNNTMPYLVEEDIIDFDAILGMECLRESYASIYCRT